MLLIIMPAKKKTKQTPAPAPAPKPDTSKKWYSDKYGVDDPDKRTDFPSEKARRQWEYRQRKKTEAGGAEFKKKQVENKRNSRARMKEKKAQQQIEQSGIDNTIKEQVNADIARFVEIVNSGNITPEDSVELKEIVDREPNIIEKIKGATSCLNPNVKSIDLAKPPPITDKYFQAKTLETKLYKANLAKKDQNEEFEKTGEGRYYKDKEISNLSTVRVNIGKMTTVHRLLKEEGVIPKDEVFSCSNFDWAKNYKEVIKVIQKYKPKSAKDFMSGMRAVLRDVAGFDKMSEVYRTAMLKELEVVNARYGTNEMNEQQKKNYLSPTQLNQAIGKMKKGTRVLAIAALYTKMPPRRLVDYRDMKIIKEPKKGKAIPNPYTQKAKFEDMYNPRYNYVILDKQGNVKQFVYNRYKTDKMYGQQLIPHPKLQQEMKLVTAKDKKIPIKDTLPKGVVEDVSAYIEKAKLQDGDFLFPVQKNKNQNYASFSSIVSESFKKYNKEGKAPSVNVLRHTYITDYLATKKTLNQKKILAYKMAHDQKTQAMYEIIEDFIEKGEDESLPPKLSKLMTDYYKDFDEDPKKHKDVY